MRKRRSTMLNHFYNDDFRDNRIIHTTTILIALFFRVWQIFNILAAVSYSRLKVQNSISNLSLRIFHSQIDSSCIGMIGQKGTATEAKKSGD